MWPDLDEAIACEPANLAGGMGKALFIAPHFTDAVLRCADLLGANPGSCVVGVFDGAGRSSPASPAPDRCPNSVAEARARHEEDLLALFLLEAEPIWLDIDASSHASRLRADLVDALRERIALYAPDSIVFPLGMQREEDRQVAEACLALCASRPDRVWIACAGASAKAAAAVVDVRVRALRARGFVLEALTPLPPSASRLHVLDCYGDGSVLEGTSRGPLETVCSGPEQYWQVRRCC